VNGDLFVECNKQVARFADMLSKGHSMLDAIARSRNAAVDRLTREAGLKKLEPQFDEGSLPKRPRKELCDEISRAVDVNVDFEVGGGQVVAVLASAKGRYQLWIKLDSVDILGQKPRSDERDIWSPSVRMPDVKWFRAGRALMAQYFCAEKNKTAFAVRTIPSDGAREAIQERVNRTAAQLQNLHDQGGK
ncbi:unnamed protein product, partial [Prorocentrum cordatum]